MRKNRYRHDFVTDPNDIARYLESIAEGFKNGELRLTERNRQIVLKPGPILELSVDAARQRGRVGLTLSFSWDESHADRQLTLSFDRLEDEGQDLAPNPEDEDEAEAEADDAAL